MTMLLKHPFTSYVYHYGLHVGLPYGMLKGIANFCDASQMPLEYFERQRLARDMQHQSEWRGSLPQETGFLAFSPGDIPGLDTMAEIGKNIYDARADAAEDKEEQQLRRVQGKSPITHMLREDDFVERRELLDVATNRPISEIMTDYFGTVPRLDNIDLWASRPNQNSIGSQLLHLDKPDRRYVSIFLNVMDVTEENGPLTFLAAEESSRVRRETQYEKLYFHGNGRLEDADLRHVSGEDKLIKVIGPAGAGGIVDTSECLHFGSRSKSGVRVVMIVTYMLAHKPGQKRFRNIASQIATGDRLKSLLLGAN
jgi:hypothetical protein